MNTSVVACPGTRNEKIQKDTAKNTAYYLFKIITHRKYKVALYKGKSGNFIPYLFFCYTGMNKS